MTAAVRCITDLITRQGLIGIDLTDVRVVLEGGGRAVYGEGRSDGLPTVAGKPLGGLGAVGR